MSRRDYQHRGARPTGIPVDSSGGPTIDPTKNVLDLVEAAVRRLNDLLSRDAKYYDSEISHTKELAALREAHQEKMALAESARIDSIRSVDVTATATALTQVRAETNTLAASTLAMAENLRSQNAARDKAIADQIAAIVDTFGKRLAPLEQLSYVGMGKEKVTDPQLERLAALVEKLATAQSAGAGTSAGRSSLWMLIVGGVGLLAMLLSLGLAAATTIAGVVLYFSK